MDSVEMVLKLCEERKVKVSRLEKDLGFGNGYIKALRRGKIPVDRAKLIADYFNVPIELFTGDNEKAPSDGGERELSMADIKYAFFGGDADLATEEDLADVRRVAAMLIERRKRNGN